MRTQQLCIALAAAAICTTYVRAVELPVMAFTNSQISANIEFTQVNETGYFAGDPSVLDRRFGTPYSDSTPFLAPQATYIGQNLYGGSERTMYDNTDPFSAAIRSRAQANTGWRFDVPSTSSCPWHAVCLMCVKKADFLSQGDTKLVQITDSSTFSARVDNIMNYESVSGADEVRCVVKNDETLYISEQTKFFTNSLVSVYTFTGLASSNWAVYTPATALRFDSGSATFSPLLLTNVTEVGMYFSEIRTAPTVARVQWKLYRCVVAADVIPEPGSLLFVFAAAGVIATIRRR